MSYLLACVSFDAGAIPATGVSLPTDILTILHESWNKNPLGSARWTRTDSCSILVSQRPNPRPRVQVCAPEASEDVQKLVTEKIQDESRGGVKSQKVAHA